MPLELSTCRGCCGRGRGRCPPAIRHALRGLPAPLQLGEPASSTRETLSTLAIVRPWAVGMHRTVGPDVGRHEPEEDHDAMVEPTDMFKFMS